MRKIYNDKMHDFECVLYVNIRPYVKNFAHVSNDDCYHKYYAQFFSVIFLTAS